MRYLLLSLVAFAFASCQDCPDCTCNGVTKEELYESMTYSEPLDLPVPEYIEPTDPLDVFITEDGQYSVSDSYDSYDLDGIKTWLTDHLEEGQALAINADKNARYELVFDIIAFAKEGSYKIVLKSKT